MGSRLAHQVRANLQGVRAGRVQLLIVTSYGQTFLRLLAAPFLARYLGPAGRGDLAVLLVIDAFAIQALSLGIPQATGYLTASNREKAVGIWHASSSIIRRMFLLSVTAGLTVLVVLSGPLGTELAILAAIATAIAPLTAWGLVARLLDILDEKYVGASLLAGVPSVVQLVLVVALLLGDTSASLTLIFACTVGARLAVSAALVRRRSVVHRRAEATVDVETRKELVGYGLRSLPSTLGQLGTERIDQLILVPLVLREELGRHAVAVSLSTLAVPLIIAVAPKIFAEETRPGGSERTERWTRYLVLGTGLASATAAVAGMFLIVPLFGEGFRGAEIQLLILALVPPLYAYFMAQRSRADARGNPGLGSRSQVSGLVVQIPLMIVLASYFGIRGAAVATVAAGAVRAFVAWRLFARMPAIAESERTAAS